MKPKKRAIYTVLFGNYEALNELIIPKNNDIEYLCFTDNPALVSTTWDIRLVRPFFPGDLVRSQRFLKIMGNEYLENFAETIYIDNSVILQKDSVDLFEFLLSDCDISMPLHSFRNTVADEFEEVLRAGLDSPERIEEQLSHYASHYPESMSSRPLWTAIIARRQNALSSNFSQVWAAHVLRYSRRDQLSVRISQHITGTSIKEIEIENHSSPLHVWPVTQARLQGTRMFSRSSYDAEFARLENEISSLSVSLNELRIEKESYQNQFESVIASNSWKITSPLRSLRKFFSENSKNNEKKSM